MFDFIFKKLGNVFSLLYLVNLNSHNLENITKIKKIQNKKIKKLMKHAYTIPFYRKKFDEVGLTPNDFNCAEDLMKFPVLTKQEIREWILPTVQQNPDKYKFWSKVTTSGSSGTPLTLYVSPIENAMLTANWLRIGMCNGYNPLTDKTMALKDPKLIKERKGKDSIIQKFGIASRHCVSFLSDGKTIYDSWMEKKPDYVYIQKSKLVQMLMYVDSTKAPLHIPKSCAVIGEGIDKNSKALLDKYLGDVIWSSYGAMETGACTFTKKGSTDKHLITNDTHIINLKNNGDMLVTNLFFKNFPIINYDINDKAQLVQANDFRYICNIKGKANDNLTFKDGSVVGYQSFYSIMESRTDILQFRIIQKSYEEILIQLVKKPELNIDTAKTEAEILSEISDIIQDKNISYTFQWLKELEADKNGKRRFIVSEI